MEFQVCWRWLSDALILEWKYFTEKGSWGQAGKEGVMPESVPLLPACRLSKLALHKAVLAFKETPYWLLFDSIFSILCIIKHPP